MAALHDECAKEILDVIPSVMRFIRSEMRGHRSLGLSVPQFRALLRVGRIPGISLGEVAGHLGLAPASTSTLVDGLVQRGLVMRAASSSDRRRVTLSLTPEGLAAVDSTTRETQKAISAALAQLTAEQIRSIRQGMAPLRAAFTLPDRRAPGASSGRAPAGG